MLWNLVCLPVQQSQSKEVHPAFELAKKLVGKWEGKVGKKATVTLQFSLEHNGAVLVTKGVVGPETKHPMVMKATMGWDPVAKQVYYLDQHGVDTIYFGHVTKDKGDLLFDFVAVSGDTGHYRSRCHIDSGSYESEMSTENKGKWVDLGFHLKLKRVK